MSDAAGRRPGQERLEEELSELLTAGEMKDDDRERKERELISPRYEIRTQTQLDPIVEETRLYREMAEEIDDRYDDYMQKAQPRTPKNPDGSAD